MSRRKLAVGRFVRLTAPVFVAFCIGTLVQPGLSVRAGIRDAPTPRHFLSGGERALPVLAEISETLKQIDTRLARMETAVKNFQPDK